MSSFVKPGVRTAALAVSALVAVAALTGCGASSHTGTAGGAALFATNCSQCHSLIGNESLRRQGGDLLGYHFSRSELTSFTREMPVRHRLDTAELDAVVDYVLGVQDRHPAQ